MATEVKMPQMGESIAEGTITKWLKQEGDTVEADEPLFEISTDKVDAEIPSPASGTLSEIVVGEGETVEVQTVVAKIEEDGEGSSDDDGDSEEKAESKSDEEKDEDDGEEAEKKEEEDGDDEKKDKKDKKEKKEKKAEKSEESEPAEKKEKARESESEKKDSGDGGASREERIKTKSSPLVRKIASEHDVDITKVEGSGVHGRVTKDDILAYIEERDEKGEEKKEPAGKPAAPPKHEAPKVPVGAGDSVEPMSRMRKLIAEHMVQSKQTAAHVHSMHEVDMSRIDAIRAKHKKRFAEANGGAKLTYTVFIAKAVVDALREMPVVNASVSGDDVVYHGDVNLGMAVALDWGLIVPVIKQAQDLSMSGLAKSISDIANRARNKQLKPEEVEGSTFSITNYGAYGGLMGTPVINQPNSAILGVGTVEKRVVVVDDMITIRPRMFLTLGYDHRLIDGAVAGQFLLHLKKTLENFDETAL